MAPLKAVGIGLGHRTELYASYALEHPDELQIAGAADPDPGRLQRFADKFSIPPENCVATSAELARRPRFADVAINGTMDRQHVPTTLPLLEAGYDVLLEKPICPDQEELLQLLAAARSTGRKVMICHVLRYAPFYVEVRRRVAAGQIGELIAIRTVENVSYHHMAVGDMHGGGDLRLVADFLRIVRGEEPSLSTTDLMDSINGHMIAFAADAAMSGNQVIETAPLE